MSALAGAEIYTGAWVDWSRGAVLGSTITLSARYASILTAFLALFVTIVGSCLWRIVSFMLHQYSSSPDAKDGLHHQHQLVFRNTGSPAEAAKLFAEIAWHWRKNGLRAWLRSLPLALFALLFLLAFGAASVLTGLVTRAAGSQRLIVSDDCGFWALDQSASALDRQVAMQSKDLNDTILAATYARQCYGQETGLDKLRCSLYTQHTINFTVSEVDCPFGGSICSADRALKLDSGLIDSHVDLGINTPEAGRVGFRKVTTCSPLKVTSDYVSVITSTGLDGLGVEGDRIRQYQYGTYSGAGMGDNITYMYNQHAYIDGFEYELMATQAPLDSALWLPIPELEQTSADLSLVFLAPNAIKYSYPNNDPFFAANFYVDVESFAGVNLSYFSADEYVNVMACQDQYQYCNGHDKEKCTPLTGYQQAYAAVNSTNVGLNVVQEGVATRIILNSRTLSIYHSIGGRGAQALRVSETIQERAQLARIPDNQWQTEVRSWFATSMARLQRSAVEYAAPSLAKDEYPAGSYLQEPFDTVSSAMCYSQKVGLVFDTVSFSVLGLVIILAVGVFFILLYLILEPAVEWWQRRSNAGGYRRIRWVMDDKMQVQRMMFEEAGMGGVWTNLDGAVPITESKEVFGDLHHVDPKRPRLGRQWTGKLDTALAQSTVYHHNDQQRQPQPQQPPQYMHAHGPPSETMASPERMNMPGHTSAHPTREEFVSPVTDYSPVLGTAILVPTPTPCTNSKMGHCHYQVYQNQVYHAITPECGHSREGSLNDEKIVC